MCLVSFSLYLSLYSTRWTSRTRPLIPAFLHGMLFSLSRQTFFLPLSNWTCTTNSCHFPSQVETLVSTRTNWRSSPSIRPCHLRCKCEYIHCMLRSVPESEHEPTPLFNSFTIFVGGCALSLVLVTALCCLPDPSSTTCYLARSPKKRFTCPKKFSPSNRTMRASCSASVTIRPPMATSS